MFLSLFSSTYQLNPELKLRRQRFSFLSSAVCFLCSNDTVQSFVGQWSLLPRLSAAKFPLETTFDEEKTSEKLWIKRSPCRSFLDCVWFPKTDRTREAVTTSLAPPACFCATGRGWRVRESGGTRRGVDSSASSHGVTGTRGSKWIITLKIVQLVFHSNVRQHGSW